MDYIARFQNINGLSLSKWLVITKRDWTSGW